LLTYAARRLLLAVPVLIGVSFLVFAWTRALPGGPAQALLGERATPEAVAAVERSYGLDRPLLVQYGRYLERVLTGDFGVSVSTQRPVVDELRERFPATLELALAAMLFAVAVGIPLGVIAAKHVRGPLDHASLLGSLIGISMPVFFLALLLKWAFAVRLGWLPSIGRLDVRTDLDRRTNLFVVDSLISGNFAALWDAIRHLILPAIALGTIPLAIITRITRSAVLDVMQEDHVRTARAKGLAPRLVDRRHVLRNALLPVVTVVGLQTGLLLSGAILTETVFAWGGIGTWVYDAVGARDYAVLQGGILFVVVVFVVVNLLVDVAYSVVDPRIRVA
jgi:peptide/nickel transport system permease protein